MQRIELHVSKRAGEASAADLRREGTLPGIFYGAGGDSVAVACNLREFSRLGLGSSGAHLIRFTSDDADLSGGVALVKEIQGHPVQGTPIHVDFLRVDPNKPVEANVTVHFPGKCIGVVEGGILQPLRREIAVRALPDALPEYIDIDVTDVNVHDSIHIEDVKLPDGVEAIFSDNYTIVTVVAPTVSAEDEAADAAEGEEGAAEDAAAAPAPEKEGD